MSEKTGFYALVYAAVRQVPRGAVCSYGDVAAAIDHPRHARQVGYALAALKTHTPDGPAVPWQRVVNSKGQIAGLGDGAASPHPRGARQALALQADGVDVDDKGRVVDFRARRHVFGSAPIAATDADAHAALAALGFLTRS